MTYSYRPSRGVYRRRWRPLPRQRWIGTSGVPPPPPVADVPVQIVGGRGPVMRPDFDHLAGLRPNDGLIRDIRSTAESLRRTTRAEVPV